MSPKEKSLLSEYLSSIGPNELRELRKKAASLRTIQRKHQATRHRASDEDEQSSFNPKKVKSQDDYLWQVICHESAAAAQAPPVQLNQATVVGVAKTTCRLLYANSESVVSLRGHEELGLAVGDQVYVLPEDGKLSVRSLVPRRTVLSRPDVMKKTKERVIAANIDILVVVVSIVSPPLHPRLIDRYLVAVQRGGSEAVIAVNKIDLAEGAALEKELRVLAPYRALGVSVFECSASTRFGIPELRSHLKGRIAAFVGHSGVGKSSLINAFDPRISQAVGTVGEGYGRGTHTTTSSSLIDLDDLRVIDTPGIRSFGLWDLTADDLHLYFPEFALAGRCKFSDCSHTHEPRCAVKEAVENRIISRARYDTYMRIFESLGHKVAKR